MKKLDFDNFLLLINFFKDKNHSFNHYKGIYNPVGDRYQFIMGSLFLIDNDGSLDNIIYRNFLQSLLFNK